MLKEALEAPDVLARMLGGDASLHGEVAARIRAACPPFAFTLARGSSDHAASFAGWLIQSRLGLITASLPPSLWTRAGADLRVERALALAVSQSGRGPDVVATTIMARERGALTVAVVNDDASPLAAAAEHVLPLRAGPERGVAATKTVLASLALVARLVARWAAADQFEARVARLPEAVRQAQELDWRHAFVGHLASARACFVISRGPGLAIAQEIALKLQEVAGLPALACSSAEFQHGPKALLGPDHPALFLPLPSWVGEERERLRDQAEDAPGVLITVGSTPGLRSPRALDPDLDPILLLAAAHPAIEALAGARGRDPDRPPRLEKVTRTF